MRVEFTMLNRRLSIIGGKVNFRNDIFLRLENVDKRENSRFSLELCRCWWKMHEKRVVESRKRGFTMKNLCKWNESMLTKDSSRKNGFSKSYLKSHTKKKKKL